MSNMDFDKKNKKKYNVKKNIYCGNCGKLGHTFKNCLEPITSYGFIGFNIDDTINYETDLFKNITFDSFSSNIQGIKYNNEAGLERFGMYKDKIKFLLIRRRHTLGYMEFIRGHYKVDNIDGIIYLFRQMVTEEIEKLGQYEFDELWIELWGYNSNKDNEYKHSKEKFIRLKEGGEDYLNLEFYIQRVKPQWTSPEWGFPKGRRIFHESNIDCAVREFEEETGLADDEYSIFNTMKPLEESLIGTNGIQYKHVYYICKVKPKQELHIDVLNRIQSEEIGDIGWFTFYEALDKIRPYHKDRIQLLIEVYTFIINSILESKSNTK
jgi:8-oxo-dGTP pyrophosphatase MutT (NUDIX family)